VLTPYNQLYTYRATEDHLQDLSILNSNSTTI